MNKKVYTQPSITLVQLDNSDIICISDPYRFRLFEDIGEYGEDERPGVSQDIWGNQW